MSQLPVDTKTYFLTFLYHFPFLRHFWPSGWPCLVFKAAPSLSLTSFVFLEPLTSASIVLRADFLAMTFHHLLFWPSMTGCYAPPPSSVCAYQTKHFSPTYLSYLIFMTNVQFPPTHSLFKACVMCGIFFQIKIITAFKWTISVHFALNLLSVFLMPMITKLLHCWWITVAQNQIPEIWKYIYDLWLMTGPTQLPTHPLTKSSSESCRSRKARVSHGSFDSLWRVTCNFKQ